MKHHSFLPAVLAALLAIAAAGCVGGAGASPGTLSATAPSLSPNLATPPLGAPGTGYLAPTTEPSGPVLATVEPGAPATPAAASVAELDLSETDNGKTFRLVLGGTARLTLNNIYWTAIASSNSTVLGQTTAVIRDGAGPIKCIPGSGCGTTTAAFHATAPGTATITAHRSTCGVEIPCASGQMDFAVTIVVEG